MGFFNNPVGMKLIMAVTGVMMAVFVIAHLLGNTSIFVGPDGINKYAAALQSLGPFIWIYRIAMIAVLSVHVFFGFRLYLDNRSARPQNYTIKKTLRATTASRTMFWTGLFIAAFLIYHLLHFTIRFINPVQSSGISLDGAGRPDIFKMVVLNFQNIPTVLLYIIAVAALGLHLSHGLQSTAQTFGLNNDRTLSLIKRVGLSAAIIIFLVYASIPFVIWTGILKV